MYLGDLEGDLKGDLEGSNLSNLTLEEAQNEPNMKICMAGPHAAGSNCHVSLKVTKSNII